MKRREFIAFLGSMAIAAPYKAIAQTSKTYRLGTLTVGPPIPSTAGPGAVLVAGLAQRGYALGENLAYEARGAAGKTEQLPQLMEELKAANVGAVNKWQPIEVDAEYQDKQDAREESGQGEADQGQGAGDLIEDRIGPCRRVDADRQRDQ